jgi:hypothetical protein
MPNSKQVVLSIVIGLAGAIAIAWTWAHHHRLTVKNEAATTIQSITIRTRNETIVFENLAPGSSASAPFTITGDDSFKMNWKLADGKEYTSQQGYVTSGLVAVRITLFVGNEGSVRYAE